MKCERCNKMDATFHYNANINGEITEIHMCHSCAKESGIYDSVTKPSFSGNLMNMMSMFPSMQSLMHTPTLFSGISPAFFMPLVLPVAAAQHPSSVSLTEESESKIPADAGQEMKTRREISALQHQMETAIKNEDFEKAAALRDQIRSLKS